MGPRISDIERVGEDAMQLRTHHVPDMLIMITDLPEEKGGGMPGMPPGGMGGMGGMY